MTTALASAPQPRVVLVDLSSLFWNAWHATKDQAVSEAASIVRSNLRRCYVDGDLVAVCCDMGRSFRKDLLPEYKAQRPEKDDQSLGELDRLKATLVKDGYLLWGVKGFEADDVIATACETAVALGHEVLICSADKDLLQLLRPGVRALRTHNWTEVDQEATEKVFGVRCDQIGDWLALVGDKSDNIPGAKGIGDKTASDLLKRFGTIDSIYVNIDADPRGVGSKNGGKEVAEFVRKLDVQEADVRLSRKLVALRTDVPFDFREIYQPRAQQPLAPVSDNPEEEEIDDMDSEDIPISRGPGAAPKSTVAAPPADPPPAQASLPMGSPAPNPPTPPAPAAAPAIEVVRAAPAVQTQGGEDLLAELLGKKGFVPVEYDKALEPRNPEGAIKLAVRMFNSRLYPKFANEDAVLAAILRGRSMGIPAATALECFKPITAGGQTILYPSAQLVIALASTAEECEYFYCEHADAESATWVTKNRRNPKEARLTYTIEQARKRGLIKPDSAWDKDPEPMNTKMAGARLGRREYPRATLGLIAFEEIDE